MTITVSLETQGPLVIFHSNLLVPKVRLTDDVGLPGALTVLVPEITVQIPVPTAGVFPLRLNVLKLQKL